MTRAQRVHLFLVMAIVAVSLNFHWPATVFLVTMLTWCVLMSRRRNG